MKPGDLLDLWDAGQLVCAVYLGEEKGRHKVVTAKGREQRVLQNRIANVIADEKPQPGGPEEPPARARSFEQDVAALVPDVDLRTLWELTVDEGGNWSVEDLTELALGEAGGRSRSAVLRALVASSQYFHRKQLTFLPRSREELEQHVRRVRAEQEKQRHTETFLEVARRRLDGQESASEPWPEGMAKVIASIEHVAVFGNVSTRIKEATPLVQSLGFETRGNPELGAFELLVRLGVLDRDVNLLQRKYGVRREFPAEVMAEAEALASCDVLGSGARRDLTSLASYAIDGVATTEVDDSISIEPGPRPRSFRVGIHIADPDAGHVDLHAFDPEAYEARALGFLRRHCLCSVSDERSSDR